MIETDRLISPAQASPHEEAFERSLRPRQLAEYVGQEKIRGQLAIFIEAARTRRTRSRARSATRTAGRASGASPPRGTACGTAGSSARAAGGPG